MIISPKDTAAQFSLYIETISIEKSLSIMEAILWHCESTGMEIELAARMIVPSLKSKLQVEFEALHFLPKSNTQQLPI